MTADLAQRKNRLPSADADAAVSFFRPAAQIGHGIAIS